jgi:chemotaxis regulatin CheY-phosphate phosphatase CheZ
MLELYSQGSGSAAAEAEKSANNIEGSFNRLKNTWIDTIENVINSDAILSVTKALNGMLSVVNNITDKLGSFGTISTIASGVAGAKGLGLA